MTGYLVALGHRDICFVGNARLPWFARCFDSYRRSMAAGRPSWQNSIGCEDDTEIGCLVTKSLLARREAGTAIFAGNDHNAHGVYKVSRDRGLRIPEDISVRGCDDTVGAWLCPGLTTIRDFPEQLGRQIVKVIFNRIAKPAQSSQHSTIPTELVKRDSCHSISSSTEMTLNAWETVEA
jgi:DNA-binding LacI/PurR family transcriptional regulator